MKTVQSVHACMDMVFTIMMVDTVDYKVMVDHKQHQECSVY